MPIPNALTGTARPRYVTMARRKAITSGFGRLKGKERMS